MPFDYKTFAALLFLTALPGLPGCASGTNEIVSPGMISQSEDLWISGGNMYLPENDPGFLFGLVKRRDENREFSYVLITRQGLRPSSCLIRK